MELMQYWGAKWAAPLHLIALMATMGKIRHLTYDIL